MFGALLLLRLRCLVHSNRALNQANAFSKAILDNTAEAVVTLDANGVILTANPAAARVFGRPPESLKEKTVESLLPTAEARIFLRQLKTFEITASGSPQGSTPREMMGHHSSGELFPIRLTLTPLSVPRGRARFVATIQDLTEQRRAEQQAAYLTDHDPLTGLLNQRGAILLLDNLLQQAERYRRSVTAVHLGVSRLTHINAVYGRTSGDAVLMEVAGLLRRNVRASDVVIREQNALLARTGGDRFLIILPETDVAGAKVFADRLLQAIGELRFNVGTEQMHVDARIGIAAYPEHAATSTELVSHAESALAVAKGHAVSLIHVFDPAEREEDRRSEQWVDKLHTALQERRFILFFQPIQRIADAEIHHYEVLLRLQEPDGALVEPEKFIGTAERFGLITRIDYRVLELAFSYLAALDTTAADVSLSVNLSGLHIGDDQLFRWLECNFEEHAFSPDHLIFEITETAAIRNLLQARTFMQSLSALGCRFALDDFGVGFSSFAHLQALPVDYVKIDGTFVRNLPRSARNRALVQSLTNVAHSLGKLVVAEYVEDAETLTLLTQYGVDYAQGYYIGRPAPELSTQNPPAV